MEMVYSFLIVIGTIYLLYDTTGETDKED